jgi:hypothetical protein
MTDTQLYLAIGVPIVSNALIDHARLYQHPLFRP